MATAMKDFISGVVSGVVQVFVMQPFQIIKIRLANQSLKNPDYKGILDCFNKIKHTDGIKGFYRGTLSPLLGIGPQVAMQFATNQFVKRALRRLNQQKGQKRLLNLKQALASGFLTGIPSAIIVTPVDLIRIKMQTKTASQQFKGTSDVAKHILKNKGLKGVFQGFYPTLLRQTIALSVYFGNYEYGKNLILQRLGSSVHDEISLFASFILGGISGASSWLFTYPIDYIKTLIQSQDVQRAQYKSASQCALKKYHQQGYKTFVKGLGVTMLRSFPVNGIGFVSFEVSMSFLGKINQNNNNFSQ